MQRADAERFLITKVYKTPEFLNPSKTMSTFLQRTRTQLFFGKLSKPCHVGIHLIVLLDEYPRARVSAILSLKHRHKWVILRF